MINGLTNVLDILIVLGVVLLVVLASVYLTLSRRNTEYERKFFVLDTEFRSNITKILENVVKDINILKVDRKDIIAEKLSSERVVRKQTEIIKELREKLDYIPDSNYTFDILFNTILEIKSKADKHDGSVDVFTVELEKLRESLNKNSRLVIVKKHSM